MWDTVLDILFPLHCADCGAIVKTGMLCAACRERVHIHSTFFCGMCRARLPGTKKICHRETPFLLAAATDYTDAVRALVKSLKFRGVRGASASLGDMLVEYLERLPHFEGPWIVAPVPLGKKRLRTRGFNQAEILAERAAHRLGFALRTDILERAVETKPQTEAQSKEERLENLHGAFAARPGSCRGFSVILVDDVCTSGATLAAAARTLRSAGAKKVIGLVAAKA